MWGSKVKNAHGQNSCSFVSCLHVMCHYFAGWTTIFTFSELPIIIFANVSVTPKMLNIFSANISRFTVTKAQMAFMFGTYYNTQLWLTLVS